MNHHTKVLILQFRNNFELIYKLLYISSTFLKTPAPK